MNKKISWQDVMIENFGASWAASERINKYNFMTTSKLAEKIAEMRNEGISKRRRQTVKNLRSYDGEYYNFFNTPGSIGSLNSYLAQGFSVVFINDDPKSQTACVILER